MQVNLVQNKTTFRHCLHFIKIDMALKDYGTDVFYKKCS